MNYEKLQKWKLKRVLYCIAHADLMPKTKRKYEFLKKVKNNQIENTVASV
jgi:hypothetical protein